MNDKLNFRLRLLMTALVFSVPLVLGAGQSACNGQAGQIARDTAADCGSKLATTVLTNYAPKVTLALADANYVDRLNGLKTDLETHGIADGFSTLACIVSHIVASTPISTHGASEPGHAPSTWTCDAAGCRGGDLQTIVHQNGSAWLLAHPKPTSKPQAAPTAPAASTAPLKPIATPVAAPPALPIVVVPEVPAAPAPVSAPLPRTHRARVGHNSGSVSGSVSRGTDKNLAPDTVKGLSAPDGDSGKNGDQGGPNS